MKLSRHQRKRRKERFEAAYRASTKALMLEDYMRKMDRANKKHETRIKFKGK